jgi:hypothetical protein
MKLVRINFTLKMFGMPTHPPAPSLAANFLDGSLVEPGRVEKDLSPGEEPLRFLARMPTTSGRSAGQCKDFSFTLGNLLRAMLGTSYPPTPSLAGKVPDGSLVEPGRGEKELFPGEEPRRFLARMPTTSAQK